MQRGGGEGQAGSGGRSLGDKGKGEGAGGVGAVAGVGEGGRRADQVTVSLSLIDILIGSTSYASYELAGTGSHGYRDSL